MHVWWSSNGKYTEMFPQKAKPENEYISGSQAGLQEALKTLFKKFIIFKWSLLSSQPVSLF